ncbi:MAG TPA: hypothetical protein VIM41_08515 [Gammaproteobacteria bacterium]
MAATEHSRTKRLTARIIAVMAVFIALNAAAWLCGDRYARLLLPVYQWAFETLTPHYSVLSLRLEQENGERIIKVRAQTAGARQLAGRSVQSGVPVSSSTLAGHGLQHVIVLFTAILLWPVRHWWERAVLIVLAIPMLLFIEMLDVPLVLAGALEDLVLFNFDEELLSSSFLVQGMHIMNNGGRLALSLIAAALTIAVWRAANSRICITKR